MKDLAKALSQQFVEVQLEGKWVANTNLKEVLKDVSLSLANKKIKDLNTIGLLCYHIHYYIKGVNEVFEGKDLTIRDKYSFDMPEFNSEEQWETFKTRTYNEAEKFATHIAAFTSKELFAPFVKEQYGDLYRNITAMISHSYYHLGQIVLLKKLLKE